jgi:hypothetical protein
MLAVAVTTRDNARLIRVHRITLQFVAARAWRDVTGTSVQTPHSLCSGTEEAGMSARFPVTKDILKRS